MPPSTHITLSKIRWHLRNRITQRPDPSHRARTSARTPPFLGLRQHRPDLGHACPPCREHAVLHAVQVAAVNGRDEAARHEAEDDTRCQVMLAEAVAKLEVLVEHGAEWERNRLYDDF